jgi:hypothetical protein
MLHAGRTRFRVPLRSSNILNHLIFPATLGPGVYSATNRNEYREFGLGIKRGRRVRLITASPSVSGLPIQCGILDISHP